MRAKPYSVSQFTIKDHLHENQLFLGRAVVTGVAVVLLVGVLIVRLANLQIISHAHFQTLSRENRVKLVPLAPTRGLIHDRAGVLLAHNLPFYSLEVTPEQIEDMQQTLADLAEFIQITDADRERFERLRHRKRRFEGIPLRLRLSDEEVARFSVNRHRFPGVDIQARLHREYPLGELTAHVLGYVGRISEAELQEIDGSAYAGTDYIGKTGVEKTYEDILHGRVGHQQVEINAPGRTLRVLEQTPPAPGQDLRLFLDVRLQEEAMAALGDANGAVVAMEPDTGGVLALASKPGFDPNLFVEGIDPKTYNALNLSKDKPLFNRALRGQYPPGSTVKPFVGLAGLELAATNPGHTRYCPGFYRLPGHSHKYRDWKKGGHGTTNLDKAIVQSCDVYFYDLARTLGVDPMHNFLALFGFGNRTGIDLAGERGGLLPSSTWKRRALRQPWYPGETLIMGIGQGYFLSTPLQLAYATSVLATGGQRLRPRVVESIQAAGDAAPQSPATRNELAIPHADSQNWARVVESMRRVVHGERGTARRIRSELYEIAGKTGTAQVYTVKQDEEYDKETVAEELRDHALFVAFAPVEAPRIAVAVIVEHGGSGGSVAAPIAGRVLESYLNPDYSPPEEKPQQAQEASG